MRDRGSGATLSMAVPIKGDEPSWIPQRPRAEYKGMVEGSCEVHGSCYSPRMQPSGRFPV
eukprot:8252764-Heterocapsa_arctica.AAC.1